MPGHQTQPIVLTGARVVLASGDVELRNLHLAQGIITHISNEAVDMALPEIYDGSGLTIFPGFIDIHIHGAVGVDTMNATGEDLHRVSRFLATQGVTAWLPTLVPGSDQENERALQAIDDLIATQEVTTAGARALGVHYEGPFVNTQQCGALRTQFFRTFKTDSDLLSLPVPKMSSALRLMTVAPEIEGGIELIRCLKEGGWIVSIGHTRASIEKLELARETGARHMTHFMNAMPQLHHRSPGPVGWGLLRDDVTVDVIADGIHVDPMVLRLVLHSKTSGRVVLISDAVAPAGLGDGEYRLWDEKITVSDGRTSNERGSIAGSVISLFDAVRLITRFGLPESDIARLSSTNAAKLLGIDEKYGSIAEGKRADLVGMDGSGNVRLTIIGGIIAFDSRN